MDGPRKPLFPAMLDDDSNASHKELVAILSGSSSAREVDFAALDLHFKEFNKAFIQNLALKLFGTNAGAVVDVLLKKLEIIERWWRPQPSRIAIKPGPLRKMGLNALNKRAMDVSAWILALDIPELPSVDWRKIENIRESVNDLPRHRLVEPRDERRVLDGLRRVIRSIHNAKPYRFRAHKTVPEKPPSLPRTKAGAVPPYIIKAIDIYRQHNGNISIREIARRVGKDHSLIARNRTFRMAKSQFDPEFSTLHEKARAVAKGKVTTHDVLRPSDNPTK